MMTKQVLALLLGAASIVGSFADLAPMEADAEMPDAPEVPVEPTGPSGAVPGAPVMGYTPSADMDAYGQAAGVEDIEVMTETDPAACAAACSAVGDCDGFTWFDEVGTRAGNCYLKNLAVCDTTVLTAAGARTFYLSDDCTEGAIGPDSIEPVPAGSTAPTMAPETAVPPTTLTPTAVGGMMPIEPPSMMPAGPTGALPPMAPATAVSPTTMPTTAPPPATAAPTGTRGFGGATASDSPFGASADSAVAPTDSAWAIHGAMAAAGAVALGALLA